ncbi:MULTISPECIES: hypothetical protein [unclassified Streptomyces]|uniref:hypothetical protein n=1 Tax=unclassified Streptomyces TaxID=2593676 RepID=UPI0035E1546F
MAGDINYPPADPASSSPDYAAMLPYNRSARTRLPSEVGGQLVPDRRVTEILAYTGFVDAAAKLFEERGTWGPLLGSVDEGNTKLMHAALAWARSGEGAANTFLG